LLFFALHKTPHFVEFCFHVIPLAERYNTLTGFQFCQFFFVDEY
jgi:hypothetical protein